MAQLLHQECRLEMTLININNNNNKKTKKEK